MRHFQILAQPWWVNLLLLVPVLSYVYWKPKGLLLSGRTLLTLVFFAVSFGFVEAAVVVYLQRTLGTTTQNSAPALEFQDRQANYREAVSFVRKIPNNLLRVELCREAATMVMLVTVALLASSGAKERWAAFLWTFGAWDIAYYAGLRAALGWPASLLDYDVLFLIPVPWLAQVWFPVVVSALGMVSVGVSRRRSRA